jgi:hypothetical protein
MKRTIIVAALAVFFIGTATQAAEIPSNPLVDAVVACKAQTDEQVRLRCYDATVASLAQATSAGSLVVVDREDVRKTRRSLFGFTLPKLPFFGGDDSQDEQANKIEAKIKSARNLGYDKWLIELDSDAAWQTTEALTRQAPPKPGQSITIKKGAMGSYFLSVESKPSVRAMRVR